MARNLKQINNAENHLIVGSIEVLGDISNSGMKQIKKNVRSLQDSMTAYVGKTTDYWSKLSNDGIITPLEKTMLKKEWETIAQTYSTIMTEAVAQQVTNSREIIAYQAAYNDLRYYLNTTLAIFDEMSMDTAIDDREEFNEYFATYYQCENLVQVALAVGKIGTLDFTVVDNLNFEGTDDQVVIYKGELYQWVHDHWKKIGTNGYCGLMNSLPSSVEGNYFLASQNFSSNVSLLAPDGKNLVSPEGDILCASQGFEGEYIYEYTNGHWSKVTDTNDYRYIVAMSDYYNLTGRLPAIWQDTIDDINDDITGILSRLGYTEDEIAALLGSLTASELRALIDSKVEHVPEYLGLISATSNIPTANSAHKGDWFLWVGMGTSYEGESLYKGYVYKCTLNTGGTSYSWQQLAPNDTTNSSYYMSCLKDMLAQTDVIGTGSFNVLFANAFFANAATINALKTKTIELTGNDALIKSENYIAGSDDKGFLLKADGTFECVDGTFKGNLVGATGVFNGDLVGGKVYFSELGLYGLSAGEESKIENTVTFDTQTNPEITSKKVKYTIDCANSDFRLFVQMSGYGIGDTFARPTVNMEVFVKINGEVSESNYDYHEVGTFNSGYSGTMYYLQSIDHTVHINLPGDYIEILYKIINTYGGARGKSWIGISTSNRYLKSVVDVTEE